MNAFLADVIWLFHVVVVLFVLLAPLSNTPYILLLHFVFGLCLIVHWAANSNACSLTVMECQLRGVPVTQSFSHKFIAPVYDISQTSWSTLVYSVTIFTMIVSLYKLYNSNSFDAFKKQVSDIRKSNTGSVKKYFMAFHSAFF